MSAIYPIALFVVLTFLMWLGGYMAEHLPDYYEDMLYWWLQETDE